MMSKLPPLKPLHPDTAIDPVKLAKFGRLSTEAILNSLSPGQEGCLKTREDRTILDGHHRICELRKRGIIVDDLPRDIIPKQQEARLRVSGELYWLEGAWPGKLAIAPRPRGGDWLEHEIAQWKQAGISSVLSLLTSDEERDLDLRNEASLVKGQALAFYSFPIPDRQVPQSETKLGQVIEILNRTLSAGRNVLIHCRQGVGRSGLVAACLLVRNGMSPGAAVGSISTARGVSVPETTEQRVWIERYAPAFAK